MNNIWFIRTDSDDSDLLDISEQNPFIYSLHGICAEKDNILKHKEKIFPQLLLNQHELKRLIWKIKLELIKDGTIDPKEASKQKCDLAIRYWLDTMQIGDIVFVRNREEHVLICRVNGYISEAFFDAHCCFQRPVEILGYLKNETPFEKIWKRTRGRKTIERNAQKQINELVPKLLLTL